MAFIGTQTGWLYLAVVLDLFSRAIVGWAMATKQDEALEWVNDRSVHRTV